MFSDNVFANSFILLSFFFYFSFLLLKVGKGELVHLSTSPMNAVPAKVNVFSFIVEFIQGCHSSETEKFLDFSLTSGKFSLTLNL